VFPVSSECIDRTCSRTKTAVSNASWVANQSFLLSLTAEVDSQWSNKTRKPKRTAPSSAALLCCSRVSVIVRNLRPVSSMSFVFLTAGSLAILQFTPTQFVFRHQHRGRLS